MKSQPARNSYTLRLLQAACALAMLLSIYLLVLDVPFYYRQLSAPCLSPCAAFELLTPEEIARGIGLGLSLSQYAVFMIVMTVIPQIFSLLVGGFLAWRTWQQPALLVFALILLCGSFYINQSWDDSPIPAWLWFTVSAAQALSILLLFFIFPTGRFEPRWARWAVSGWVAINLFRNLPFEALNLNNYPALDNLQWILIVLTACGAQIYRFLRVSSPVERQQTKWLVLAILIFVGLSMPLIIWPPLKGSVLYLIERALSYAFSTCISLAIVIAILRYKLWDIDLLIRRTLVYGLLSASLALVYFGAVIVLERIIHRVSGQAGDSPFAIVLSTLVIAALFSPLRRRIQAFIDRRFYRRKYNAEQTLQTFAATVRDEVDLDLITAHVVGAVRQTMQPDKISVWLISKKV